MEKKNITKEKLHKINKVLNIISYILNFFFILIFVLALCTNNKKSNIRVNAYNGYNDQVNDLVNTLWVLPDEIEFTPSGQNYEEGLHYIETYSIDFYSMANQGKNLLLSFEGPDIYYDLSLVYENGNGWEQGNYRWITIVGGSDTKNPDLVNWFNEYAFLGGHGFTTFTFSRNFNYNAPYKMPGDSQFVTKQANNIIEYSFGGDFISNGQVFTGIRLVFVDANGTNYFESPGSTLVRTNNNTNLVQFNYMEYINTMYNISVMVCSRNFRTYYNTSSSSTNMALDFGVTWTNSNFQVLNFITELDSEDLTKLNQFNNYDLYTGSTSVPTDDVGLGNVFTLLSGAFGAITSIFAIQLLPGISIGLFFFMPLIVGIILFIIWLIKR